MSAKAAQMMSGVLFGIAAMLLIMLVAHLAEVRCVGPKPGPEYACIVGYWTGRAPGPDVIADVHQGAK